MSSTTVASNSTVTFSASNTTVTIGDNVTFTLNGSNDTVSGGNNDVVIDAGSGNTIIVGTGGSITINGSNDHDVTGASSTGVVNGANDGLVIGTNSTVTLDGSNDASNAAAGSITIVNGSSDGAVVTAGTLTITGASDLAQVLNGSTATITSSASGAVVWSPNLASANTVTDNGTNDSVTLGNGSVLVVNGTYDTGSIGANATAYVNGAYDTLAEGTGSYAALQGGHDVGTATGTGNFNLVGNSETATVATGGYIGVVSGSNQVANVNGGTVTTLNNVQVTIVGSGDKVNGGTNSTYNLNGNNDTVTEGSGSLANLNGSNDIGTATGTGNINIDGANDTATVGSGAYVGVITGSTGAIVNDSGGTVVTLNNVSVTVNGSGTTVNGGANSSYTVEGNSDTLSVSSNSSGFISGTNDTLNENGNGDQFNVQNTGNGTDTSNLRGASGDYVGLLGGSGYTVTGSNSTVDTWDNTTFSVTGNNDLIGADAAPDGSITTGSNVTVNGTANTVSVGQGDSLGVAGGGNTINLGGADAVYLTGTGGTFDTVYSNGDSGGTAADGQAAGIVFGSNTQANIGGSSNAITANSGDSLGVVGSANIISNVGAGDAIYLTGTSGTADTVYSNGDSGGTAGNGQAAGIVLDHSTQATIDGSDNAIIANGGIGATATIVNANGDGNQVSEGTDSFTSLNGNNNTGTATGTGGFNLDGTNDAAHVADGAYIGVITGSVNAAAFVNDGTVQTNDDVSVTVTGSGDTVNGGSRSNYNVYGDSTTLSVGDEATGLLIGTNDTLVENGAADALGVYNNGAGNDVVYENGASDNLNLVDQPSSGTSTVVFNSYNDTVGLSGSGLGVVGSGGTVNAQNNTNFSVIGNADGINTGANDTATIAGTNDTVNVNGASSVVAVFNTSTGSNVVHENAANDFVNVQDQQPGGASQVNLNSTGDYAGLLGGTNYTVTGVGGSVATWQNTSFNVAGYNDVISAASGDTAAVIGGGNSIYAASDTAVIVAGTGTDGDAISVSNDPGNITANTGVSAGVTLLDNAQANVIGSGNAIEAGTSANLGVFGNGNAVVAGANATLAVNGDYNQTASLSGGSVTFEGVDNSAALNNTALYSADGNPITFTGVPSDQGNVAAVIDQSPEVEDQIDEVYLEVLGRSVDSQGLAQAQATLIAGGSLNDVRTTLVTSQEVINDFDTTLSSVGADAPTSSEVAGFESVMSGAYDDPIQVISHEGTVLADTSATNLLAELPVLETLDNGRTLSLGLDDGSTISFQDTAHLTDFLYGVAVQKSQADSFVTDTFNQDINWLNQVDQPLLEVSQQFDDLGAYNTSIGNSGQATLSYAAARVALNIAGEAPGSRADMSEKVAVNGHETEVTVFASATNTSDATFHDIDPGIGGILETIGVAILNVAAIAFPETGLPYAAAAADAAVAGQDFANGQILDGILQLASAAGSFEIGLGGGNPLDAATQTGRIIDTAAEGVGGVYGAVQSAQNGDPLGVLAGALEATAAVASGIGKYDPSVADFANKVSAGLSSASVALSVSDAFAKGNLAGGLISSLNAVLSNIAGAYADQQATVDRESFDQESAVTDDGSTTPRTMFGPSQLAFGTEPNLDYDGSEEAGTDNKVSPNFLRTLGLIGTDAHNTLADYNNQFGNANLQILGHGNATVTYNSTFGGLFGGDRPDFVINFNDGSPLQVIELKTITSQALGASQLAGDLAAANANVLPGQAPIAVAGDPKLLFNGFSGIALQSIGLLAGQEYDYSTTPTPGVAVYTTIDRPSAISQAFSYLAKFSPGPAAVGGVVGEQLIPVP